MPTTIIVDEGSGSDSMDNSLCIADSVLKNKKDGDEVEATIKGTLVEYEGKRYIDVSEVDGEPVEDMAGYSQPSNDQMMGMDANMALDHFMQKTKGK